MLGALRGSTPRAGSHGGGFERHGQCRCWVHHEHTHTDQLFQHKITSHVRDGLNQHTVTTHCYSLRANVVPTVETSSDQYGLDRSSAVGFHLPFYNRKRNGCFCRSQSPEIIISMQETVLLQRRLRAAAAQNYMCVVKFMSRSTSKYSVVGRINLLPRQMALWRRRSPATNVSRSRKALAQTDCQSADIYLCTVSSAEQPVVSQSHKHKHTTAGE